MVKTEIFGGYQEWTEEEITEFMKNFRKQSGKTQTIRTQPNPTTWAMSKTKHPVSIDDPRPPIKQRLGIEGEIGKCPHCLSEKVYHDKEEEWICGFCYEDD